MRQNQDPNQRALDRIKAKAMEDFQGAVDMGVAQPGSFENWAMMNAPQYFVALQQSRAGGAAFGQAQTQANGPKSDEYNRVRELLANAVNSGQPQAGFVSPFFGFDHTADEILQCHYASRCAVSQRCGGNPQGPAIW